MKNLYKFKELIKINEKKENMITDEKRLELIEFFKSNFTMEKNVDENHPRNVFFYSDKGNVEMENRHQYKNFLIHHRTSKKINRILNIKGYDYEDVVKLKKELKPIIEDAFGISIYDVDFLGTEYDYRWEKLSKKLRRIRDKQK